MKRLHILLPVFVLLMLCACRAGEQPNPYMQPIEGYYCALADNSFAELRQAMPSQTLDALGLDAGELANFQGKYNTMYGSGFRTSVSENGSVRLNAQQMADLQTYLVEEYGIRGKAKDAYLVEYTVSFSGAKQDQIVEALVCYALDNSWYIDPMAGASIASIRKLYN